MSDYLISMESITAHLNAKSLFGLMPFLWWFEQVTAFRGDFQREITEILEKTNYPKKLQESTLFALVSYRFKLDGGNYVIKNNIIDLYHTLVTTAGKHVPNAEEYKEDYAAEKYVLETYMMQYLNKWKEIEEKEFFT